MSKLLDQLHSEIDTHEDLREQASKLNEDVRGQIGDVLKITSDPKLIMQEFALRLENELAPLTTKAVRLGLTNAKGRSEILNGKINRN